MAHKLRGAVSIIGIGLSRLGNVPGYTAMELLAEAVEAALKDSALSLKDIDGLFGCTMGNIMPTVSMTEALGVAPRFTDATNVGGASFLNHVISAAAAIEAGLCEIALIAYGSNQLSGAGRMIAPEMSPLEAPYAPRNPITGYALAAQRHMHVYGTKREQLAEVAVAARNWATLNERAMKRSPLSIDDVLSARRVVDPFGVLDCCLISDGGGAIILTSTARARALVADPIALLGGGSALSHRQIAAMPDLTRTAAAESAARAYQMAGVAPSDIDVVQLYDAFTITPIIFLEDLGFCSKGEGGSFVENGRIGPGGALPVNTNGGGLSCVHTGMYGIFLMIEAIEQLRRASGARQVPSASVALCHGNGGMFSSQTTLIFGRPETL
jgi:acetyl-CoA acetyltransferase